SRRGRHAAAWFKHTHTAAREQWLFTSGSMCVIWLRPDDRRRQLASRITQMAVPNDVDSERVEMSDSGAPEPDRFWDPEHPVLQILRRRRETGSKPGARDDSAKIALAIEGGGMRGVISAAMCTQLDDAGFSDAFDVVYVGS